MFQINITKMPIKCWHLTGISITEIYKPTNIQAMDILWKFSDFDM